MAFIYYQDGKWDRAVAEYKKILVQYPTDLSARNMLGDSYSKLNRFKEAYREYYSVVEAYIVQGAVERAESVFRKMAGIDPGQLDEVDRAKLQLIKEKIAAYQGKVEDESQEKPGGGGQAAPVSGLERSIQTCREAIKT